MNTKTVGKWVAVGMAIVAAASQGALKLPVGLPEWVGTAIMSWSGFIMSVYLIINPFLPADAIGQAPKLPVMPPLPPTPNNPSPPPSKG